ncbi:Nitrogen permease regulator 2 [Lambiella insularis]|nr:Nitrogen permease regulator 2 [Lambiella insularis]
MSMKVVRALYPMLSSTDLAIPGPKVVHQVPTNSIVPAPNTTSQSLIHFPSVASIVIPRQTFCSLPIALLHSRYRILGHPICLASPSYPRNEFIFNFCLVLSRHTDPTAYASVANKLAILFKHLEETSQFLSQDTSAPNTGKVYALCEILLEDLNNYCECMIPIDASNTLNIKLFPIYPQPPPVCPHHVPLSTVRLGSLTDSNWDLTMLLILPHIDGVNSVKQIALHADADYKLVRKAIEHLLYYGCVTLLDIFSFKASYAPTAEIGAFVTNPEVQEECRRYILLPETGFRELEASTKEEKETLDGTKLVELYCSLREGQSVKSWCMEHADVVMAVDVRRFITFGVIKGFLYRIHKYAIAISPTLSSKVARDPKGRTKGWELELKGYLDGNHCFDEICTELMINERELLEKLKEVGDVQIVQK